MILKIIDSDKDATGFSRWARERNIALYFLDPRNRRNPDTGEIRAEKSVYSSTKNMVVGSDGGRINPLAVAAEFEGLARMTQSKNPLIHAMFSVPLGTQLTIEQWEQMVDLACEHWGVGQCARLASLHGDTKYQHMHVAIQPIDPLKPAGKKLIPINKGLTHIAAQQAAALITKKMDLAKEAGRTWDVDNDGRLIQTRKYDRDAPATPAPLPSKVATLENKQNIESDISVAQRIAFGIIRDAKSWDELHQNLARRGMYLRQPPGIRNGAQLLVGNQPIKLSSIAKKFSLSNLSKRFGAFLAPSPEMVALAQAKPLPRKLSIEEKTANAAAKELHKAQRAAELARYRQHKKAYNLEQQSMFVALRKAIKDERREFELTRIWTPRPIIQMHDGLTPEIRALQKAIDALVKVLTELLFPSRPEQQPENAQPSKADRLTELSLFRALRPQFPNIADWRVGNPPRRNDLPRRLHDEIRALIEGPRDPNFRRDAKMVLDRIYNYRRRIAADRKQAAELRVVQDRAIESARQRAQAIKDPKTRYTALKKVREDQKLLCGSRLSPAARAEQVKARIEPLENDAHRIAWAASADRIATQPKRIAPPVPQIIRPQVSQPQATVDRPQTIPVAAPPKSPAIVTPPAATPTPIANATQPPIATQNQQTRAKVTPDDATPAPEIELGVWPTRADFERDTLAAEKAQRDKDRAYLEAEEARIADIIELVENLSLPGPQPEPKPQPQPQPQPQPPTPQITAPTATPAGNVKPASTTVKYGSELLRELDELVVAQRLEEERDRAEAERAAAATVSLIENATWLLENAEKRPDIAKLCADMDCSQSLIGFGRYPHKAMLVASMNLIMNKLPARLHDAMVLGLDDDGRAISMIRRMTITDETFREMWRKAAEATAAREQERRLNPGFVPTHASGPVVPTPAKKRR